MLSQAILGYRLCAPARWCGAALLDIDCTYADCVLSAAWSLRTSRRPLGSPSPLRSARRRRRRSCREPYAAVPYVR